MAAGARLSEARLRASPVRSPGLQRVAISGVSCRPRALTRRFGRVCNRCTAGQMVVWTVLTPALSPKEWENRRPASGRANRPSFPADAGANAEARRSQRCPRSIGGACELLPILGGEGQGEDERSHSLPGTAFARSNSFHRKQPKTRTPDHEPRPAWNRVTFRPFSRWTV
jgi:hypothetical protein